jgi:hypothetical protein
MTITRRLLAETKPDTRALLSTWFSSRRSCRADGRHRRPRLDDRVPVPAPIADCHPPALVDLIDRPTDAALAEQLADATDHVLAHLDRPAAQ